jgi:hypothetical protein
VEAAIQGVLKSQTLADMVQKAKAHASEYQI